MKIKWEEKTEKEMDLLDILKLEDDGRRKRISVEYEDCELDIYFSYAYKGIYISNFHNEVVLQVNTNSGLSEKTIATMVEWAINEFVEK